MSFRKMVLENNIRCVFAKIYILDGILKYFLHVPRKSRGGWFSPPTLTNIHNTILIKFSTETPKKCLFSTNFRRRKFVVLCSPIHFWYVQWLNCSILFCELIQWNDKKLRIASKLTSDQTFHSVLLTIMVQYILQKYSDVSLNILHSHNHLHKNFPAQSKIHPLNTIYNARVKYLALQFW